MFEHSFLLVVLQKYGFGERFLKRNQVPIKNQESCAVTGGITTKFFRHGRGAHQRDPMSAFLFILALEVTFILIKTNNKIKGLDIYSRNVLYTAYADDSIFFFKNKKSVTEAFKILDQFSFFSGLKPNKGKCQVAVIAVKKGVKMTFCGMKNIELKKENRKSSLFLQQKTRK